MHSHLLDTPYKCVLTCLSKVWQDQGWSFERSTLLQAAAHWNCGWASCLSLLSTKVLLGWALPCQCTWARNEWRPRSLRFRNQSEFWDICVSNSRVRVGVRVQDTAEYFIFVSLPQAKQSQPHLSNPVWHDVRTGRPMMQVEDDHTQDDGKGDKDHSEHDIVDNYGYGEGSFRNLVSQ